MKKNIDVFQLAVACTIMARNMTFTIMIRDGRKVGLLRRDGSIWQEGR